MMTLKYGVLFLGTLEVFKQNICDLINTNSIPKNAECRRNPTATAALFFRKHSRRTLSHASCPESTRQISSSIFNEPTAIEPRRLFRSSCRLPKKPWASSGELSFCSGQPLPEPNRCAGCFVYRPSVPSRFSHPSRSTTHYFQNRLICIHIN